MRRLAIFLITVTVLWAICCTVTYAGIIFVDANATGPSPNGISWQQAYTALQDALDAAQSGDEIWVAQGTYKPSIMIDPGDVRSAAFQLISGVGVFGGFNGTETHRRQRNWTLNTTILSADIGIEGDSADNCYHVFYHPVGLDLDASATLDGFTITGGNASGSHGSVHGNGGGVNNDGNSSPTIINCVFLDNRANSMGGGLYNSGDYNHTDSTTTIINCKFISNHAAWGGGLGVCWSSPMIHNSMFLNNSADWGGGVYFCSGVAIGSVIANCTFFNNNANGGGGISNHSSVLISNSIIWGNLPDQINGGPVAYSCIQGGFQGDGNIDTAPQFVDTSAIEPIHWNLHLLAGSPCIDAGDNAAVSHIVQDIDWDSRKIDVSQVADTGNGTPPVVDMGADEFVTCIGDFDGDEDVDGVDLAELAMHRPLYKAADVAQSFGSSVSQ
jgi:hypothetical protein